MAVLIPALVLAVIPKPAFINWLNQLITTLEIQLPSGVKKPEETDLYMDCLLFMVPPFKDTADYQKFIQDHYQALFANSLYAWCQDVRFWPKDVTATVTMEMFNDYFDLELHSRFYDL